LEVAGRGGGAVLLRQGSTGTLIGVTMNQIRPGSHGTLLRVLKGAGEWHILQRGAGQPCIAMVRHRPERGRADQDGVLTHEGRTV